LTTPFPHLTEAPGSEAMCLLEGATRESPEHDRRETSVIPVIAVVRPARAEAVR